MGNILERGPVRDRRDPGQPGLGEEVGDIRHRWSCPGESGGGGALWRVPFSSVLSASRCSFVTVVPFKGTVQHPAAHPDTVHAGDCLCHPQEVLLFISHPHLLVIWAS